MPYQVPSLLLLNLYLIILGVGVWKLKLVSFGAVYVKKINWIFSDFFDIPAVFLF